MKTQRRPLHALFLLCLWALLPTHARAQSAQDPIYVFHTKLGDMRVQLYPDAAPLTVANFLNYVNTGAYDNVIVQRSVPGFVWQGGGYTLRNNQFYAVASNGMIAGEPGVSNVRGTLAMALSNGPDSGTNEWFFNEGDNSAALDGTADSGPFTVFGKVADSASLAIMDAISNVPVPNPPPYPYPSPLEHIPLIHYVPANGVQASNIVTISSITPGWTAAGVSAGTGASGASQLLWTRADGGASFWNVAANGQKAYSATFGPFAGWTCRGAATAAGGSTRLLWTNTDGRAGVWTVAANGTVNYGNSYGPYPGWSARALSVGADNVTRLLWTNTDGRASFWTLNTNAPSYSAVYGPYTGWSANGIAVASNGGVRLLWNNVSGSASFWNVSPGGGIAYSSIYGPFAGWTAKGVGVGGDNATRLLWTNTDGHMGLWTVAANGAVTYGNSYGPYAGWSARALSTGTDNMSRVLWTNVDGHASFWTFSGANVTYSATFGPF